MSENTYIFLQERLRNFHVPNKKDLFQLASSHDKGREDVEDHWKLLARALRSFGVRIDTQRKNVLIDGDSFEIASLLLDVLKAIERLDVEIKGRAEDAARQVEQERSPGAQRRRRKRSRIRTGTRSERQRSPQHIQGIFQANMSTERQSKSYSDLPYLVSSARVNNPQVNPGRAWEPGGGGGGGCGYFCIDMFPHLLTSSIFNYSDQDTESSRRQNVQQIGHNGGKNIKYFEGAKRSTDERIIHIPRQVTKKLESYPTLSLNTTKSSLEVLVLLAMEAFRVAPKDAAALISGRDQKLAAMLINGESIGFGDTVDLYRDSTSSIPSASFHRLLRWLRAIHAVIGLLIENIIEESFQ